jgi:hypothetical protein
VPLHLIHREPYQQDVGHRSAVHPATSVISLAHVAGQARVLARCLDSQANIVALLALLQDTTASGYHTEVHSIMKKGGESDLCCAHQ